MTVHLGNAGSFATIFQSVLDRFTCDWLEFQRLPFFAHLNGADPCRLGKFGGIQATFRKAIQQDFLVLGCIVRNECDVGARKFQKIVQDFQQGSAVPETFE